MLSYHLRAVLSLSKCASWLKKPCCSCSCACACSCVCCLTFASRHLGHGTADHDDDHRMQQQDEQAAGVSDHKHSRDEHRHHQPRRQPDDAGDHRGDRSEQRDRAGGDRGHRGGSSGRRDKERCGYVCHTSARRTQQQQQALTSSNKPEPVRKGRGFAGRRSSRSPDRDRYRSSREDRNGRGDGYRGSDRPVSRSHL